MNREDLNSIVDRALSEHLGAGLFNKKSNGKYSLFMPLTGTGENGSAPDQLEKTVIGNKTKTYTKGRKDNPQITIPFYAHRDNYRILEAASKTAQEFLRVNPDMTAIKYAGEVDYKTDNTDTGNLIQGELSITVTRYDGYVDNVSDVIENTAIIESEIPEEVNITGTGEYSFEVTTNPASATITAKSETEDVATVKVDGKKVTITGVKKGNAIVEITTVAENNASFKRTLMVFVTEA
jgi:uncharacterized protein YjdB